MNRSSSFFLIALFLGSAGCGRAISNFEDSPHQGDFILGKVRNISLNFPLLDSQVCLLGSDDSHAGCTDSDIGGEFVLPNLGTDSEVRVWVEHSGYWPAIGMINTSRSVINGSVWGVALIDSWLVGVEAGKVDGMVQPGTGLLYVELEEPDGSDGWKLSPHRQFDSPELGTPYYFNGSWLDKGQHDTSDKGAGIFVNVMPGSYSVRLPAGCAPHWAWNVNSDGMMPAYVKSEAVTLLNVRCP